MLITSSSETNAGALVKSESVAIGRLKAQEWPIYSYTKNRSAICVGDKVVAYAAGGLLVGASTIINIVRDVPSVRRWREISIITMPNVALVLLLEKPQLFVPTVKIKSLLNELSFIPNHGKWGSALMGGTRKISQNDYRIICAKAQLCLG